MGAQFKIVALLLAVAAVAGCASTGGTPSSAPSPADSARQALGAVPSPAVTSVSEANFRTPSKNIACVLTRESVRCDIGRKKWVAPSKPADCELEYGSGMFIEDGRASFICAGYSVLGAATTTLAYGQGLRAGDIMCDSESFALRCVDEKTTHGFTLAIEQYNLF